MIRIEHAHHARNARLRRPSARIAGKSERARSRAVIRTIARDDLVTSGKEARNLDRVLVGLSSAVGKEECVDVSRSYFRELRPKPGANFSRHERIRVCERLRLLGNRLNDTLITMSDVDRHQLTVEVDETTPFRRVEVNALGASNRNRIDLRLRRPFIQRVLACEIDDFLAGHGRRRSDRGHVNPFWEPLCSSPGKAAESAKTCGCALWPSVPRQLSCRYRTRWRRGPARGDRRSSCSSIH